ncbi:chemotaxis protein CheB [Actinokineospora bangkokensis]|uniref:chemotaxis protein CheB n=1 Tax=Actinokineospora bangkokensis TaxID=1193682 RepID=UPI000AB57635|nr:chemotaxis protein CheB [Actinokineospora bangkokensis]
MQATHRDLVVVGASAGGVEALRALVAGLPEDLPAAVAVVLHVPRTGTSALARILDRAGPLPATTARQGEPVTPGRIVVAPPDHHLVVVDGRFALTRGPTENGHRPAVDALFRSAAVVRGARTIGVVLSGTLDDGAAGCAAIRRRGGAVIVQDPVDALYPGMPEAVRAVVPAAVLPAAAMGPAIAALTRRSAEGRGRALPDHVLLEDAIVREGEEVGVVGTPSEFSCPDCRGVLNQVEPTRFRCQVGHAWTAAALGDAQDEAVQRALWTAVRSLEERTALAVRMADAATERGDERRVSHYRERRAEASDAARVLRTLLNPDPPGDPRAPEHPGAPPQR